MKDPSIDTIAAFSTPPGESGLAVFRISGPQAGLICDRFFRPSSPAFPRPSLMEGYRMAPGLWADIDQVVLACFRAPHSYTGEDLYEVSCHGGQAVRQAILASALSAGARAAGPGDFDTEWMSLVLGLKVVGDIDEAIAHTNAHSMGWGSRYVIVDGSAVTRTSCGSASGRRPVV